MKRIRGLLSPLIVGLCSITVGLCSTGGTPLAWATAPQNVPTRFNEAGTTGSPAGITTGANGDCCDVHGTVTSGLDGGGAIVGTFTGSLQIPPICIGGSACGPCPPPEPMNGTMTLRTTLPSSFYQGSIDVVLTNTTIVPCSGLFQGSYDVMNGTGVFAGASAGPDDTIAGRFGNGSCGCLFTFETLGVIEAFPPCTVSFVGCRAIVTLTPTAAIVASRLVNAEPIGILVERIVGKRFVLVGRVPFGVHHKGRVRIHWNLRVNGKKLHKGRYRITLRALDKHGNVIGLAKPVTIIIH